MTDPQEALCTACGFPARNWRHLKGRCVFNSQQAPSSAPPAVPAVEEARTEAERRYAQHAVDFDGWYKAKREAFIAGAEWAREAEGEVEYRIVAKESGRELESPGPYARAVEGLRFFGSEGRMERRTVSPWSALAESESIGDDGTR